LTHCGQYYPANPENPDSDN